MVLLSLALCASAAVPDATLLEVEAARGATNHEVEVVFVGTTLPTDLPTAVGQAEVTVFPDTAGFAGYCVQAAEEAPPRCILAVGQRPDRSWVVMKCKVCTPSVPATPRRDFVADSRRQIEAMVSGAPPQLAYRYQRRHMWWNGKEVLRDGRRVSTRRFATLTQDHEVLAQLAEARKPLTNSLQVVRAGGTIAMVGTTFIGLGAFVWLGEAFNCLGTLGADCSNQGSTVLMYAGGGVLGAGGVIAGMGGVAALLTGARTASVARMTNWYTVDEMEASIDTVNRATAAELGLPVRRGTSLRFGPAPGGGTVWVTARR